MRSELVGLCYPRMDAGAPPLKNPGGHSPAAMQNRLQLEVVGPDGEVRARREHIGNVVATFGLNRLCELIATGGEASNLVAAARIGTSTVAESSTHNSLIASTGSVAISGASMDASDQGDRTLRYVMTFASNNPAGAAEIHEVGLFCNSTANSELLARSELGTDSVNKGASDEIRISYDCLWTTA